MLEIMKWALSSLTFSALHLRSYSIVPRGAQFQSRGHLHFYP